MAVFDAVNDFGRVVVYDGTDGTNDNDIIIETNDISRFDTFMLSNAAGAVDVEVNDGSQWLTAAPLSMSDLGATTTSPVLVTSALRQYGWRGSFFKIRVRQNGATPGTGVVLRCQRAAK